MNWKRLDVNRKITIEDKANLEIPEKIRIIGRNNFEGKNA
jgi:hypothetical protein